MNTTSDFNFPNGAAAPVRRPAAFAPAGTPRHQVGTRIAMQVMARCMRADDPESRHHEAVLDEVA